MVQAVHQTGRSPLRGPRRALHYAVDKEERHELRALVLDVSAPARAIGCEGEGYAVEVSDIHLVQRVESKGFVGSISVGVRL